MDINEDPDFAYYLYYCSRAVKGGHLRIDDPKADVKAKGDKYREELALQVAIWQTLADEDKLRKIASAWDVENVDTLEPDAIRFELQKALERRNELQRKNPLIKGTREFLEDLSVNDYVRLSYFLRQNTELGLITYTKDGRYRVGDKDLVHVPSTWANERFVWLCDYFNSPSHREELKNLMHDVITKEYLDGVKDNKDFRWIAEVAGIEGYFNKSPEQVKEMVYKTFVIQ